MGWGRVGRVMQGAELDGLARSGGSSYGRGGAEALFPVCAADPVARPGMVALEDTRALLGLKERLDAHLLLRLRDVEQRGLHDLDALPTIGTWVDAQSTSVDRSMVAPAPRTDRLPTVPRQPRCGRPALTAAQQCEVQKLLAELDTDPILRFPSTSTAVEHIFRSFANSPAPTTSAPKR